MVIYISAVAVILACVIAGIFHRHNMNKKGGSCDSKHDLTGKVFIVTGGNSGLGKATVENLSKRSATVIMACRNVAQGQSIVNKLQKKYPKSTLVVAHLDLSSLESVRSFTEAIVKEYPAIHCLINNAGVYVVDEKRMKTADGFELHFGVNHLGHFLLTQGLLQTLKKSAPSRVVTVSSVAHERGNIDFTNLNFEKEIPPPPSRGLGAGYCNSKLANAVFSWELARKLKGSGVSSFTLCPGFVDTGLYRNSGIPWYGRVLFFPIKLFMMRSPESGAQTILHCATSESLNGTEWGFFKDCEPYASKKLESLSPETAEKLWDISEMVTKSS